MLIFVEGGKAENPEKNPQSKAKTNNKLNPHMTPGPGFEPGQHWWEASALTTAPTLLSGLVFSILQFDSSGKQFGSNIVTRIQLSVKIKLKSLFVPDTTIDCSLRRFFMSLGSQRVYNNLECVLIISIK